MTLAKSTPTYTGTSPNGVACSTFNTGGGAPAGCTIHYTIVYKNVLPNPAQVSGETGDFCSRTSTAQTCYALAGMQITDDGTLALANWAQYTTGIAAAATDVPAGAGSFV